MPRKRRWLKRRDPVPRLRPIVRHFLETGEIVVPADGDSRTPWIGLTLSDRHAREARACWQRGDVGGAIVALGNCSAAPGWFAED